MFSEKYIRNNFLNSLDREELLRDTPTEIINKNMLPLIEEDTIENARLDKVEALEYESIADELTDLDNNFPIAFLLSNFFPLKQKTKIVVGIGFLKYFSN